MSIDIEFRAWDEQAKAMHKDFQFIRSGAEGNDWIVFTSDRQPLDSKPHPFENPYFQQQLKVMQYTGLKDKNGKKIFEGDLLRFPAQTKWEEENYTAYEVFFHDGDMAGGEGIGYRMCRCHHHGNIAGSYIHSFLPKFVSDMVIAGNIHENPELTNGRNQ